MGGGGMLGELGARLALKKAGGSPSPAAPAPSPAAPAPSAPAPTPSTANRGSVSSASGRPSGFGTLGKAAENAVSAAGESGASTAQLDALKAEIFAYIDKAKAEILAAIQANH
jgi:hypothetical protein